MRSVFSGPTDRATAFHPPRMGINLIPKSLVVLAVTVSLVTLLLVDVLVQAPIGLLSETRRDALIATLGPRQMDDGSFPSFLSPENQDRGHAYETAEALQIVSILNAANKIDTQRALNYIIATQSRSSNGGALWGWPFKLLHENSNASSGDLYATYIILNALKFFNVLGSVNRTALIDFTMARYNATEGAFYEPVVNVGLPGGQVVPFTPLLFPVDLNRGDTPYSSANMVSTFLGVSVLAELGALNLINSTRTADWILRAQGSSGAFAPFPPSSDYSPNPFYVDREGTGLAFTFAAVTALNTLGYFDKGVINSTRLRQYILSCSEPLSSNMIRFLPHPNGTRSNDIHYSYYAIITLGQIGELSNQVSQQITNYLLTFLADPYLDFVDQWPWPNKSGRYYGLFVDFDPLSATYFSVNILNATGTLSVLERPTPLAPAAWSHVIVFSVLVAVLSLAALWLYVIIWKGMHCIGAARTIS